MLSIAAVVAVAGILFASTYSQTQMTATRMSLVTQDTDLIQKVREMGGLQLQMPSAFAQIPLDQVDAMVSQGRHVVDLTLTAQSVDLPIMGGGKYHAMTFSGQVPAPTVRVTQGDIIRMTLTVPSTEPTPHGNDMHASQMSAVPNFGAVKPGESKTFAYVAEIPGTFKYHCSGINVLAMDEHVLSGLHTHAGRDVEKLRRGNCRSWRWRRCSTRSKTPVGAIVTRIDAARNRDRCAACLILHVNIYH